MAEVGIAVSAAACAGAAVRVGAEREGLTGMARKKTESVEAAALPLRSLSLPKGLTYKQAIGLAATRAKRDFRGFTYDPKTGKATLR
jgi:hypothetical protein